MDYVGRIAKLLLRAHEDGTRYVFSSQVVARSYLEACVRIHPGTAVFSDSVVSWDQFKANFTHFPQGRTKAVFTDRLLFVNRLFRRERAMTRLRFYCDSSYPCSEKAYMKSIATGLPDMCRAFDLKASLKVDVKSNPETAPMQLRPSVLENAPADMIHDLGVIVPAYKAFMESSGLYDPCLYEPDFSVLGNDGTCANDYVLVFLGSFSDPCVGDALKACRILDLDSTGGAHGNLEVNDNSGAHGNYAKLKLFRNSTAETMACMRRIYSLLSRGVLPNDIAVSCPNVDAYRPYLEQEASKRDVKLTFAGAKPLTQYIPGRFFKALLRVRDENYSMDSMKAFLLDPCFPYKDRESIVGIIEKSIECKVQDGPLSKWIGKLKALGEDVLAKRLSAIGEGISAVVDCRDASMLHENVMVLVKDLFGEDAWTREYSNDDGLEYENARVFGSCVAELGTLSIHAGLLDTGRTPDLFSLFVDILNDKKYAPNTGKDNVRVYSYPLDAGLAVKHHFAIGLADSNTRVLRNPYPFLPYEKTKTMEDVLQLGDGVLGLYSHVFWKVDDVSGDAFTDYSKDASSDALNEIWLSSSEEGFSGADVVPTVFLGEGLSERISTKEPDSFDDEMDVWEGRSGSLRHATAKQRTCFKNADEAPLDYCPDMSFEPPKLPFAMGVSRIKAFEECPYKGFAYSVLKLRDVDFEPRMNDAAQIGDILHRTIQHALEESGTIGGMNEPRLKSIFREELEKYSKRPDSTDRSHISFIARKYEDLLPLFYASESAQLLKDMKFKAMEDATAFSLSNGVVSLRGMADCVLEDEDGNYAVVDFKKSAASYYKAKDLGKTSLQLAVYARMLEENPRFGGRPHGAKVVYGAYYSIEDGAFKYVWPPVSFGRTKQGFEYSSSMEESSEASDQVDKSQEFVQDNYEMRIGNLSRTIKEAGFAPTPSDEGCRYCPFYNLCRGGFETV